MTQRQRLILWLLFLFAVTATALWIILSVLTTPAHAHCYSIWHYNFPQRCGSRLAQTDTPVPPSKPVYMELPGNPDIDIPLPSLEHMEFPPDCIEDWCQRLKGIGLLREHFGTN